MDNFHSEVKKEFQLERMILFSDAVFAIAITLLVIEIKIPEIPQEEVTEQRLLGSLAHMIPKFIGFLSSFFLIGLNWTVHHRMFSYVVDHNPRLLWLNLLFLLAIVLMPFSTAFWSEYSYRFFTSPVIIYAANICFLGLMNFCLWKYIANPKHRLTEGLTKPLANYFALRAITVPIIFIIMTLVYLFIHPFIAVWIPMFIPLIMRLVTRGHKKKLSMQRREVMPGGASAGEGML